MVRIRIFCIILMIALTNSIGYSIYLRENQKALQVLCFPTLTSQQIKQQEDFVKSFYNEILKRKREVDD